ncbi:MAG: T9SS type A sorting domain-containing protein [Mesoflavibacter sp.]|nr:T9SS type A sorting domain-containing protein [Mesoflavibacter sp.]
MNKFLLSLMALLCLNFSFGQSEVIISQYIETSSGTTPKGIEIFNVSGVDITFSAVNNLEVHQGTNGGACSSVLNITSGTLLTDEVWVIGTSDLTGYATTNGTNLSGTTVQAFTFNGDDAIAVYLGGTIQDMFGLCGTDPGSSWSVSGVSTANNNLQVLDGLCDGDIDGWSDPSTRFTQIANGLTMTGFGNAPASCGSVTPPDIILNSANPATSATSIIQDTNDTPIYAFDLSVSIANATLTDVAFTTTGTYATSNITNFKLYYSADATFNASTDTFLDNITTTLGPGTHTFTGFSQLISNGSTGYLFITTDIPCTSTNGNTIQVSALLTTDLTFVSAGSVTGTAYDSDTHTIQTATPSNVTGLTTSLCENNTTTLDWTLPTDCYDNILVFATDTSFSTATPTGNGGTYTASTTFGAGTAFDGGFCVYKGTGTTETITGLTNGITYTYKVFTRNDLEWSNGVEVSCTPIFAYCDSGSTSTDDSEIENVTLVGENNTISNNTTDACTTGVNDYTAMSADLNVAGTYTLLVEFGDCNGGSWFDGAGGVWIDWNSDGDFEDTDETITTVDLNFSSANITESITINVPATQPIGNYRMRIVQEESGSAGAISPCGTFTYGSTEDYTIEIISACTPTHTITSFTPTSGPEESIITITGTGFTAGSNVDFNGTSATILSQTTTELVVEVPSGATTGVITVTESSCPVNSATDFTVIDTTGTCSGGTSFTDLIITEVYDSDSGNGWYMELYNPTGTAINLDAAGTDFEIERYGDIGDATPSRTIDLTGTIAAHSVFTLRIGSSTPNPCSSVTFDFLGLGDGINENDEIRLTKNGLQHDVVHCPNETGYSILRNVVGTGPSTTFNTGDWTTNSTESCTDLGVFSLPTSLPTASSISNISGCSGATFSFTATAGNSGTLTYAWYFNDGVSPTWSTVTSTSFLPGTVTGENSNTLIIDGFDLNGYQFYAEVTEDGTCSQATNAAQVSMITTTWSAGSWDNGIPDLTTSAIINDTYNTTSNGNIEACSLYINPSYALTVGANSYVKVQTSIYNNGELLVQNEGSVIQINNSGIYDDSGSVATNPTTVEKLTAVLDAWYEYTYWSSPVTNETIGSALFTSSPYRRFSFNAGNFVDSTYETNNNNATVVGAGVDDIDDDANDWQLRAAGDLMTPGVGYAATHSPAAYTTATNYNYSFRGPLNTGIISVPVERNDTELGDTNWNLIGNPYPSAIDATLFFNENNYSANPSTGTLDGAIYLWSHSTPPSATNNGNQQINFDLNDYITLNYTGSSVSGVTNYIASGQGFFVTYSDAAPSTTGTVTFNNNMRVDGNNNQFFRTSNINASTNTSENKLWLKLTNDFGLKDNIMIGYVNGATTVNDGAAYDAKTNGAYTKTMTFYSLIPGDSEKLSVQGKAISDLNINETIYIGFLNKIDIPTVYTISIDYFEGDFLANNTAYIKDNLLNTYHDLSANAYSFTSEVGEFNNRFEIVFTNPTLSIDQFTLNEINTTIISLTNDDVKFIAPKNLSINSVTIYDNLGRKIINLKGSEQTETYHLNTLSQSVYLAEIELSNKQKIIKKFIKN